MGRLTSAEYGKLHGAAAGKQLHRERTAQKSAQVAHNAVQRIAYNRVKAAQAKSFPDSLPGRLMGMATQHGHLSNPKSRNDWKRVDALNLPANEGNSKTQPFWGGSEGPTNSDKGSGFKGWSQYRNVKLNDSLQFPGGGPVVKGWEANTFYNKVTTGKKVNPHYTSSQDQAYNLADHVRRLAARRLAKRGFGG
ncbi:hypothetical protein UFOVP1346_24 [uncultured Caudovirales phage]|uniref:Uncharacterized protein n=1 Tax=uncultured Caudovirales phage TaxID=2100421 RepID=A0A6J5R271_9CAUD|nr:hypothetical protein UFOVP921_4 [uncultured Caudovirales phage]CAB4187621.1 hypothetical protein UFOVP1156_40 [uncultured Caudovirales phage]CAB4200111.1 hypothetical protein UFOVP1346_24 [uncultured Caudovirales phage]